MSIEVTKNIGPAIGENAPENSGTNNPDVNPDVKRAFEAITAKQADIDFYFSYFDGDNVLPAISRRLQAVFRGLNYHIQENWCEIVIKAITDRMNFTGFQVASNPKAQLVLDYAWHETELGLEAFQAHEAALIAGESYLILWRDEESGELEAYYNEPRMCHIFYEADDPKEPEYAAKLFVDNQNYYRLTLYYPDRLEHYISNVTVDRVNGAGNFFPDMEAPVVPNPYGQVPVFHFRRERRRTKSELKNIIPIQDALNMLLINMLACSEYAAYPQKYVIGGLDIEEPLQNAPNMIWQLPGSPDGMQATQVGEFSPADLTNYLSAIENLIGTIATLSATPKHYFIKQGGEPSGEALMAMESPLVKKVNHYIDLFTSTWRQVAMFILKVYGVVGEDSYQSALSDDLLASPLMPLPAPNVNSVPAIEMLPGMNPDGSGVLDRYNMSTGPSYNPAYTSPGFNGGPEEEPNTKPLPPIPGMGAGAMGDSINPMTRAMLPLHSSDIVPVFDPSFSIQPMLEAQVVKFLVDSGMPLVTALREQGWDESKLAKMEEDRMHEQIRNQMAFANAAVNAQKVFDAGNNTLPGAPGTGADNSQNQSGPESTNSPTADAINSQNQNNNSGNKPGSPPAPAPGNRPMPMMNGSKGGMMNGK